MAGTTCVLSWFGVRLHTGYAYFDPLTYRNASGTLLNTMIVTDAQPHRPECLDIDIKTFYLDMQGYTLDDYLFNHLNEFCICEYLDTHE